MPEWGFKKTTGELILRCPNCKYQVGPFTNKQACIAHWMTTNRHGNQQVLDNWARDFKKNYSIPEYIRQEIEDVKNERAFYV